MTTTNVHEGPILFSPRLVRAILNTVPGVWPAQPIDPTKPFKWQTRRVVKIDAELKRRGCTTLEGAWVDGGFGDGQYLKVLGPDETSHRLYSPYGYKQDILWVREKWAPGAKPQTAYYAADYADDSFGSHFVDLETGAQVPKRWRPSIHMPGWACRLRLEIKGVRVERLQQIHEADAQAEGAIRDEHAHRIASLPPPARFFGKPFAAAFCATWTKINGERPGCDWDSNPWVWVVEFMRIAR